MSEMVLVRAIVRPEKTDLLMGELVSAGFPAMTKMDVCGRGKQKGISVGDVHYDEIPKEMLMIVCRAEDKEDLIKLILRVARTGEGNFGDGKVFVSPVEDVFTVSSGAEGKDEL